MLIDFHAHILPGADHGSTSFESSYRQIEQAKAAGVDLLIATPHFYPNQHRVSSFLKKREEAVARVETVFREFSIQRRLGAEVLVCEGLENLEELDKLCIEDTSCILLEMPFEPLSRRILNTIYEIQSSRKLTPIMAHIDRYAPADIEQLLAMGVYAQINASALCHVLKRSRYMRWIISGQIQAIGSDSHEDRNAYTQFSKAMRILGAQRELLMRASANLLNINK